MMTPELYYAEQCRQGLIVEDAQQLLVLHSLQRIHQQIIESRRKRRGWLSFAFRQKLVTGLYLWGSVGVGKTFLLDCFYHALPADQKIRMHFYQFMQLVHDRLVVHQGKKNPLVKIAKDLARKADVICFDELFVSNITDAMLLGRLFRALFEEGVCLLATSNMKPDDLYKNGLQREQFFPAIAALKQYMEVIHITTEVDYRLKHLQEEGVFYTPLDQKAQLQMEKIFNMLSHHQPINTAPIMIYDRPIEIIKQAGDVIWFDFAKICHVPRSQKDYLAIAEDYKTIFISHIPVIPAHATDTICLFIALIDVFYDAKIKLILSAEKPLDQLYTEGYMLFDYQRAYSRLIEMQSMEYIQKIN